MHRLANFFVSRTIDRPAAKVAAQVTFGVVCAMAMIGVRSLIDIVAPTSGPFAMVYPTVLIATLFGHWRGGVTALIVSFMWAWYFVLSPTLSFTFVDPTDPPRVLINLVSCTVVLFFAEAFRKAVRANTDAAARELARRKMLMADLEHRTKNNFQLVASLLSIQKRRDATPEIAAALDDAIGRVNTFSDAYSTFALEVGEDGEGDGDVDMAEYLTRLTMRVGRACLHDKVRMKIECDPLNLPREKAVAVGLFANEALTNCGKYAFGDGRAGSVVVRLRSTGEEEWSLEIEDDGAGKKAMPRAGGGLGSSLLEAFAHQAGANHHVEISDGGARVELTTAKRAANEA
jgi:two-component sensor histidine kinase